MNLWGGRNQYTFLEKQNQQEIEDPQQYFDFLLEKQQTANDIVLLFLLSKCSWIPLVMQHCVGRETYLLKS